MTVNQRQFDQLTEMGISLWQHKVVADTHNSQVQIMTSQLLIT